MRRKGLIIFSFCLLSCVSVFAQEPEKSFFRTDGKIWVVIGVLVIILSGIFLYLISLDRKLKKIENQLEQK